METKRVVRVPAGLTLHMEGTGWWQTGEWNRTPEGDALAVSVRRLIERALYNADGSKSIRPTPEQLAFIRRQADFLAVVSRADAGEDPQARGDLNSAKAFLRRTA